MLVRCQDCHTPVFEIKDGLLIVRTKHHGEVHTSTYRLQELEKESHQDGPEHINNRGV